MSNSNSNQLNIQKSLPIITIDPTNLTQEQRKQLDDLLGASKKSSLTEKQILENRIKSLEDQFALVNTRIYTLEISSNYKMFRDNNIPNEPWVSPMPWKPFLEGGLTGRIPDGIATMSGQLSVCDTLPYNNNES